VTGAAAWSRRIAVVLLASWAFGALAQQDAGGATPAPAVLPADVREVLAGVDDHPALRAARAAVDAARAELDAVRFPIAFDGQVSAQRFDVTAEAAPGVPQERVDEQVDELRWNVRGSVQATLRPFRVGDLADLETQRVLALAQAERRLRETRASLEAGALQAAGGLLVAEHGVRLAEAGRALARAALDATRLRLERGAAREIDLRRAELEAARADERVRAATANRARAEARLVDLVGPGRTLAELPTPDALPPLPDGALPPAVAQAEDDLTLAGVGVGSAERGLLPTAQASYAWTTEDGAVSLSLESRTFQPTIQYESPDPYENLAQGLNQVDPTTGRPLLDEPATVEGALTLALSFQLGPESAYGVRAAEARFDAARAALDAARRDAALAADDRAEALRAARAELAFAVTTADLARDDADDVRRQVDLGLATPLDALQADLAVFDADLALLSARSALLDALLADYRALAVPLSEVRP
jgi:outer membrane protein TolC